MREITEDYVSFETAKLLKEKGFDVRCDYEYGFPAGIEQGAILQKWRISHDGRVQNSELIDDACAAPTLQMAMKWLRKKHKLFIDITAAMEDYIEDCVVKYKDPYYTWEVFSLEIGETLCFGEAQNVKKSYEEACEAAIKYTIENLI